MPDLYVRVSTECCQHETYRGNFGRQIRGDMKCPKQRHNELRPSLEDGVPEKRGLVWKLVLGFDVEIQELTNSCQQCFDPSHYTLWGFAPHVPIFHFSFPVQSKLCTHWQSERQVHDRLYNFGLWLVSILGPSDSETGTTQCSTPP